MIFLNDQFNSLADAVATRRKPGFALIVAFDYYDGPETGLALYQSGAGVRFSSLGDSRSRLFRAFELATIDGDWWPQIRRLQDTATVKPPDRILVPARASEALTLLERDVFDAPATGHHVGVGSPNLDWLTVSSVSVEQLEILRQLGRSPKGFLSAHHMLKNKK